MINEIKTYELDGKFYKTKEEAEKAYRLILADKIKNILEDLVLLSEVREKLNSEETAKPILRVVDAELVDGFYQTKPGYEALKKILKTVKVFFYAKPGDERNSGTMEIYISKPTHIPPIEAIISLLEQNES